MMVVKTKDDRVVDLVRSGRIIHVIVGERVESFQGKNLSYDSGMLGIIVQKFPELDGEAKDFLYEQLKGSSEPGSRTDEETPKVRKLCVPYWALEEQCFEAVKVQGKDQFLTWDGAKFTFSEDLENGIGAIIKPLDYTASPYTFLLEEIESATVPSVAELYSELHEIISSYYSHLDSRLLKFCALYIIHSYILTKSIGTIFMWFVGRKRSGKNTIQLIAEKSGYRAFSGVNPSESAIYRTLGCEVEYAPLIIVREYQYANENMKTIAREGDIPGSTVPRSDKVGDIFVVNHYHLHGSRIVGSNKLFGEEADMDRYRYRVC